MFNRDNLLKRTLYISCHRGTREMDIILGEFSKKYLVYASHAFIKIYAEMIQHSDIEILHWLHKKMKPPLEFQDVIKSIQDFHKI